MTRFTVRVVAAFALLVGDSRSAVPAEPAVNLTEKASAEVRTKSAIELDLKGELFFSIDGKKESVGLQAKARHIFAERVLSVADGMPNSTVRAYSDAVASVVVGSDRTNRSLPTDRRTIAVRRSADGLFCFAPAGPLTRDELDLVTEHFNPQCLAGLLPGKEVNVGDTWTVSNAAAQSACLLSAVIKSEVSGKLVQVKDGAATFTVEGTVEGVDHGSKVTMTNATGLSSDVAAAGRVTCQSPWKQKDDREQVRLARRRRWARP
ncbi:MAG: hypothetical protein U0792_11455 [Gemmataceae bacterium]